MNKKIGYVSVSSLDDVKTWSGTVNNLYLTMHDSYDIVPIIIPKPKLFSFADKVLNKLKISYYPRFYSSYYRRAFNKEIGKYEDVDILFGCALSHIFGSGIDKNGKKIIYLSDAVFSQMVDYYWFDLSAQRKKALNQLESNALNIADYLIYSSEWGKEGAISGYGVNENKISVMPFPAPLEDRFLNNKTVDKEEIRFLFVGVAWKRKGTDDAIECIQKLNSVDTKHKYVLDIVGLQSDVAYENVVFHGKLMRSDDKQRNELITLYQKADFFILPTKAECSPVVLSEAYEYGLPFISTRTGGVNDLVIDGETGFLFDVKDKGSVYAERIASLVNNPNAYKKVSDACRKRYEQRHSRESWIREFDRIIKEISE
ncbi:MAG: glycosyltransferase family 4 protein [Clostridia bacterium]|nr:glycosyltransferase family 4 protein [Clostridia bacterium]